MKNRIYVKLIESFNLKKDSKYSGSLQRNKINMYLTQNQIFIENFGQDAHPGPAENRLGLIKDGWKRWIKF
ncbi:MAG: hypothetical protein ABSE72_09545 [Bacteroidales bacterium]|jgi:hypothetical protein